MLSRIVLKNVNGMFRLMSRIPEYGRTPKNRGWEGKLTARFH